MFTPLRNGMHPPAGRGPRPWFFRWSCWTWGAPSGRTFPWRRLKWWSKMLAMAMVVTFWLCQNSYWTLPFIVGLPIKMVIFHSYVSLPWLVRMVVVEISGQWWCELNKFIYIYIVYSDYWWLLLIISIVVIVVISNWAKMFGNQWK